MCVGVCTVCVCASVVVRYMGELCTCVRMCMCGVHVCMKVCGDGGERVRVWGMSVGGMGWVGVWGVGVCESVWV